MMKKYTLSFVLVICAVLIFSSAKSQDIENDLTVYFDFNEADIDGVEDKATEGDVEDEFVLFDGSEGFSIEKGAIDFGDALSFDNVENIDLAPVYTDMNNMTLGVEEGSDISDFQAESQLTIAAWINLPEGYEKVFAPLVMQMFQGGKGWNVIVSGKLWGDKHDVGFKTGGGGVSFMDPGDESMVKKDTWFHMAFTYDGNAADGDEAVRSYFNGVPLEGAGTSLLGSETPEVIEYHETRIAHIGIRDANIIKYDEIRVYKRALEEGDVAALYELKPNKVQSSISSNKSKSDMYVSVIDATNELKIRNAIKGERYQIINMAGAVIESDVLMDDSATLNTSLWPKGIYIANIGKEVFKIKIQNR